MEPLLSHLRRGPGLRGWGFLPSDLAPPSAAGPDSALVQACADLLAARVALYNQQQGHGLVPVIDRKLRYLLDAIPD